MFKHVLVPLDGSDLSETALPVAQQALGSQGTLTLLNVVDLPDMNMLMLYDVPIMSAREDPSKLVLAAQKSAQSYLRRVVEMLKLPPTVSVNIEVCIGKTASVIAERAEALHVDAVVMSTHGRSGISRWMFGSVTQSVLGLMPCPVLVVPGSVTEPETQSTPKNAIPAS